MVGCFGPFDFSAMNTKRIMGYKQISNDKIFLDFICLSLLKKLKQSSIIQSVVSIKPFVPQDMSACQTWVWLLNSHQVKTKLQDTLELQVMRQYTKTDKWTKQQQQSYDPSH